MEGYPRYKVGGVYRHFKQLEGKSNYRIIGLAEKLNVDEKDLETSRVIREDTREEINLYKDKDKYYYKEDTMNGTYVVYRALYGNELVYLRHIDIFFSEVNDSQFKQYGQRNRFEEIEKIEK